jgi:tRNA nucleotidyltransferase/poly(A) polymerase
MLNKSSLLRKLSSIRLSEQEDKIFNALLEASEAMGKGTILRAAGGWVRDKLLGNDSCDIDIALDNVPGDEFAQFLHKRENSRGVMSSIGVVKENPEQSKHIRTASFRFHGLDLDINNLRSETYTEHSRIPEIQFAKHPSEDALRRDFTINALYYNLNTREVEDFTGTGLTDLEKGIIRTPLPASRTFVDDPLRVLRAIRFATRFGFRLDDEVVDAFANEGVRTGLMNKVSRERVSIEISKMMRNENAFAAVELLRKSGLIRLILTPPSDPTAPSLAGISKKDYTEWKSDWASLKLQSGSVPGIPDDQYNDYHLNYAILLSDLIQSRNPQLITRLALKLSSIDCKVIGSIISSVGGLGHIDGHADNPEVIIQLGRLVRNSLKDHWRSGIYFACIFEDKEFRKFERIVLENKLNECFEWKAVIDGSTIQKEFQLKPGKVIQELLAVQFDQMFLGIRDKDELMNMMRKHLNSQELDD